ncbi:MAG: phosphatidylserine decarboxylase, partial [Gemmatimonadales bacterium]
MSIAPEGRPFALFGLAILAVLVAGATALGGAWWVAPGVWLPITLWVPWFFRNPERPGPRSDRIVISPADGKVVSVADVHEPTFIDGPARRISVFMNVFDVHVNRYPSSGTVAFRHYAPGSFVSATLDKASDKNER